MRLSLADAIRQGAALTRPAQKVFMQHYDGKGTYAACAIGAAAYSNGIVTTDRNELCVAVMFLYPELGEQMVTHPAYDDDLECTLWPAIVQLNDQFDWTREQIADWLDSITLDLAPITAPVEAANV